MPSTTARQRNKRALESTGGVSRAPAGKGKAKGRGAGEPFRLQSLLYILLATTILLVAYQLARFYYRGHVALSPLSAWTKTKYGAHDTSGGAPIVGDARTKFNKLAPGGAAPGSPALVPGQEATDSLEELRKKLGIEGELDAQFDEDGNMDLATIQRMLDILYKPARDGAKGAYRAAGKVLEAVTEDEVDADAADAAEVDDEATP